MSANGHDRWQAFFSLAHPPAPLTRHRAATVARVLIRREGEDAATVAEFTVQRELLSGEVVHHKDENPSNDHPDNLEVLPSQSAHARLHGLKRGAEQMAAMREKRGRKTA